MFKKGQLLLGNKTGTYVEVLQWPLVRVLRQGTGTPRYRNGYMFYAGRNYSIIGNNYKAKG
ncbi:hypothetical protein SIPHO4S_00013 [Serratia phage Tsm2]|uniref:Uncharacterized protein n=1 Tax=Serratia phage Tsm2 TaxID=2787014 RepID=A0A7S9SP59_9CAUD|nr:hypothetical protein PF629_gp13 [Serratia phage Tsm2]QPI13709.1 hypothetical protein SIPHO4S_00013 [Serratia phage Tsm2]